jgi:hypothetical protein
VPDEDDGSGVFSGFGFGTFSLGRAPLDGAVAFTVAPATSRVSAAAGFLPAATGSVPPEEELISSAATKPAIAMPMTMMICRAFMPLPLSRARRAKSTKPADRR